MTGRLGLLSTVAVFSQDLRQWKPCIINACQAEEDMTLSKRFQDFGVEQKSPATNGRVNIPVY